MSAICIAIFMYLQHFRCTKIGEVRHKGRCWPYALHCRVLYLYLLYLWCTAVQRILVDVQHKGRCRPYASHLERSNWCNICIMLSFFISITTKSSLKLKYFFEFLGIFLPNLNKKIVVFRIFLCLIKHISVQHLHHRITPSLYHDQVLIKVENISLNS